MSPMCDELLTNLLTRSVVPLVLLDGWNRQGDSLADGCIVLCAHSCSVSRDVESRDLTILAQGTKVSRRVGSSWEYYVSTAPAKS